MTTKHDPYASEEETKALLVPDTRTAAERKLAQMMAERGADEQGAEAYPILRQIAVELLAEQEPVTAAKKDAVFAASIEFIGTLTGMQPPPIEVAPPEIFKPFRDFTEKVLSIFSAPQPAQQQEPVACLSETQARAILDLALDLEKTGRLVAITEGQERTDFVARNRSIQCALEDALRNATAPQPAQPLSGDEITAIYNKTCEDWTNRYDRPAVFARAIEAAHGIKESE